MLCACCWDDALPLAWDPKTPQDWARIWPHLLLRPCSWLLALSWNLPTRNDNPTSTPSRVLLHVIVKWQDIMGWNIISVYLFLEMWVQRDCSPLSKGMNSWVETNIGQLQSINQLDATGTSLKMTLEGENICSMIHLCVAAVVRPMNKTQGPTTIKSEPIYVKLPQQYLNANKLTWSVHCSQKQMQGQNDQ